MSFHLKRHTPIKRSRFVARKGHMRRNYKSLLGRAKPRVGSLREVKARLERLNARYVKLRDGQECVICRAAGLRTEGILDAGHLYPKGSFRAGKYIVENIFAQCRACNLRHISKPEIFFNWFIDTHGFEVLDALHAKCVSDWRPDEAWLVEQIAEREKQIAELTFHFEAMV